jgi:transcriptional regulator with XRE-family HTH domain
MITAAQCRAARAWLNLTQADLAKAIGCGTQTIINFEQGKPPASGIYLSGFQKALRQAFEERGILFVMADKFGWEKNGIVGPEG